VINVGAVLTGRSPVCRRSSDTFALPPHLLVGCVSRNDLLICTCLMLASSPSSLLSLFSLLPSPLSSLPSRSSCLLRGPAYQRHLHTAESPVVQVAPSRTRDLPCLTSLLLLLCTFRLRVTRSLLLRMFECVRGTSFLSRYERLPVQSPTVLAHGCLHLFWQRFVEHYFISVSAFPRPWLTASCRC